MCVCVCVSCIGVREEFIHSVFIEKLCGPDHPEDLAGEERFKAKQRDRVLCSSECGLRRDAAR